MIRQDVHSAAPRDRWRLAECLAVHATWLVAQFETRDLLA
jgi:hypothetical protein